MTHCAMVDLNFTRRLFTLNGTEDYSIKLDTETVVDSTDIHRVDGELAQLV